MIKSTHLFLKEKVQPKELKKRAMYFYIALFSSYAFLLRRFFFSPKRKSGTHIHLVNQVLLRLGIEEVHDLAFEGDVDLRTVDQ